MKIWKTLKEMYDEENKEEEIPDVYEPDTMVKGSYHVENSDH